MPTIKDIAKSAGVSHGTVSNVLNKRGCVSYEKIRLVEETARAMGYAIDEKASTLRRGKARTIAILLPTLSENQYADLYESVLRCAQQHDYVVRLLLTDDLPYLEQRAIDDALALKVCGILAVSCLCSEEAYSAVRLRKIPLLFLERPLRKGAAPSYVFDMEAAADNLIAMLKARQPQAKEICIAAGDTTFPDQQALTRALCARAAIGDACIFSNARGHLSPAVGELMARRPAPEAVFCANESIAARVRAAFAQASSASPQLYSLIPLRTSCCQDYSSLALNYRRMGHEATEALLLSAEKSSPLESRVYPPSRRTETPNPAPAFIKKRPLRILAHRTPSVDALRLMIPRFEHRTNIPVELHALSMNAIVDALHAPGAAQWDVIRIDLSRLAYQADRVLMPLDEIDPHVKSSFSHLLPGVEQEYALVHGRHYALPFDPSVQMLFYHKPLFENIGQIRAFYEQTGKSLEIPRTYEEFSEISRFFSRAHRPASPVPYGSTLALSRPMSLATEFLPRLLCSDETVYTQSGCLNLLTPQVIKALEAYIRFAQYVSPKAAGSWGEIAQRFINQESATTIIFTNHSAHFVHNQGRSTSMEIGFATIPGKRPVLGGASFAIGRSSAQPQEAYEFIRWATSEENAPELVMLGGSSACTCIYEYREILDTYPWLAQLPENIRLGLRRSVLFKNTDVPAQYEVESVFSNHLLAALKGHESPIQALEETQRVLEAMAAYAARPPRCP